MMIIQWSKTQIMCLMLLAYIKKEAAEFGNFFDIYCHHSWFADSFSGSADILHGSYHGYGKYLLKYGESGYPWIGALPT